jgi:hypothetical protein
VTSFVAVTFSARNRTRAAGANVSSVARSTPPPGLEGREWRRGEARGITSVEEELERRERAGRAALLWPSVERGEKEMVMMERRRVLRVWAWGKSGCAQTIG